MGFIKAVIFDFDGLLVNTEELREQSLVNFLKKYGKEFVFSDYKKTMLGSTEDVTKFLKSRYRLKGAIDVLSGERRTYFNVLFQNRLALQDGVSEVLGRAKSLGLKLAIASNRSKADVTDALQRLGILDFFEAVVNVEEVANKKPDPEIYLLTAEKLGVDPSECLVLEDAPHGVEAGKGAGMRVIYVPSTRYFENTHEKADLIVKSLHEVSGEILKNKFNK